MKRPDRLVSSQGLLLVEAVLSAVVIAVGLVFISRGLGGQLRAIEAVEAYEELLPLAQSKLNELEGWGLKQQVIPERELAGHFIKPYEGYHWRLEYALHRLPSEGPSLSDIKLVVFFGEEKDSKRKVTLEGIWPAAWFSGA